MGSATWILALALGGEGSWTEDLDVAQARARAQARPLLVVYAREGCRVCREFDRRALSSAELESLLPRFVLARIDVERQRSVAIRRDIRAVPAVEILDSAGRPRSRVTGAVSASELRQVLQQALEDRIPEEGTPPAKTPLPALEILPDGFRGRSICGINVGYGPLALPSQSPFQSLRFGLLPRTPSTLARGQVELGLTETWVNVWALDEGGYFLDYEMLQSTAGIRYGLSDVLQLELEYSQRSRFGGSMDDLIQGFHDLADLDQSGRDGVPKGDFAIDLEGDSRSDADRGPFSESILLTLRRNLSCGDEVLPALSAAVTFRMDTRADDGLDGPPLDAGISVSASKAFGDFYAYLSLGYTEYGREEYRGIELRSHQVSLLVALEWRFSDSTSIVVQHLVSQGVALDLGPFSEPSHEVTLGLKVEVSGSVLQVGLIENLFTFDNSPDFGIHVGWGIRM